MKLEKSLLSSKKKAPMRSLKMNFRVSFAEEAGCY
jgi:hypothetical protein